jgi:hypothetical protein
MLQFPNPRVEGTLVYHKTSSRSYNIHDQVGQEMTVERDGILRRENTSFTKSLGDRGCTMTRSRPMMQSGRGRGGPEEDAVDMKFHGGLQESGLEDFERQWEVAANRRGGLQEYNSRGSSMSYQNVLTNQPFPSSRSIPSSMDGHPATYHRRTNDVPRDVAPDLQRTPTPTTNATGTPLRWNPDVGQWESRTQPRRLLLQ